MKFNKKPKVELTEIQKMAKKIGDDWADRLVELEAMPVEDLNKRIAQANQAIGDMKTELEADLPNGDKSPYMKAKLNLKYLNEPLSETKKRQNAIINVAVQLRRDRGAV